MNARVALVALGTALAATSASAQAPSDGKKIFGATCAACHQATGEGVPEKYPPLAGSEWVTGDEGRLVRVILHGLQGDVEVEGETFNGAMPAWGPTLSDPDIAAVATYIRASFGNKAAPVSTATVTQIRAATKSRATPWTAQELAQVLQVKK
ncbi:cytochrome c subunit of cbb3 type cytochrome oxidase (plasmid) [Gemmatirosa kalamazoonensis]|uniref:Cytochrome c subunit of cbb3 type cytochrome oxidase n=1 Tax=Gemmatirosa kalamazoonensis TaxID=861299 RepID=W0RRS8_9BACT|nr:cytochrome c [Gemmatirosa kalamazoonensis]AHG93167.1 cytochrome c subunit of cbb3 type cytochrome oxidase [Gemmatirosa kalamazoonensis]